METEEEKRCLLKNILSEDKTRDQTLFLLTPEEFSKIFTPERFKLLKLVANRPDLSITELSKLLRRKREAVSRDIRFFEGLNLIKLEKQARNRIPKRVVQEIAIKL